MTNRTGNTTQVTYLDTPAHYLETVIDANGVQNSANTFESSGRLSSAADGNGNTAHYSYDINSRTQTTIDPLGNATSVTYDADGNVIRVVDALGQITKATYDSTISYCRKRSWWIKKIHRLMAKITI